MVKVRIGKSEAVIDGWRWTSDNPVLQSHLNSLLDPLGPSAADPDPDYSAATDAARRYRGEIIDADDPGFDAEPEGEEAVY